jgi:hypothetical protein
MFPSYHRPSKLLLLSLRQISKSMRSSVTHFSSRCDVSARLTLLILSGDSGNGCSHKSLKKRPKTLRAVELLVCPHTAKGGATWLS